MCEFNEFTGPPRSILARFALLTQGLLAAFFNFRVVRLFNLAIRQDLLQRLYDEHLCLDVLMIECYFSLAVIGRFEEFHLFRARMDDAYGPQTQGGGSDERLPTPRCTEAGNLRGFWWIFVDLRGS